MFLQESSGIAQVVFPLESEGNSLITLNTVGHEVGKMTFRLQIFLSLRLMSPSCLLVLTFLKIHAFFCKVNGFMCQHGKDTVLGIYEPWNCSFL